MSGLQVPLPTDAELPVRIGKPVGAVNDDSIDNCPGDAQVCSLRTLSRIAV
jgi:hypothetical protein